MNIETTILNQRNQFNKYNQKLNREPTTKKICGRKQSCKYKWIPEKCSFGAIGANLKQQHNKLQFPSYFFIDTLLPDSSKLILTKFLKDLKF